MEARIDLFVLTAMKNSRDNVFDPHLVEQRAERRRFLDPPLDAIDRFRAGVRKALHDDSARGGNTVAPVEDAEEHGAADLFGAGEVTRPILRTSAALHG